MIRIFSFLTFFVITATARIPFDKCEEGFPGPTSFDIPECTTLPCDIYVGDVITLNIGIFVDRAVTRLPVQATIITDEETFDYPLPSRDACHAIVNGCPTAAGNYMVSFPVKVAGLEPGTTATVRVQIDDDMEDVVACGSITTTFK